MKNQYEIDYQQGYDNANEEWLDRMDKIRAEISEYKDDKIIHAEQNEMIDIVLEIINKHCGG